MSRLFLSLTMFLIVLGIGRAEEKPKPVVPAAKAFAAKPAPIPLQDKFTIMKLLASISTAEQQLDQAVKKSPQYQEIERKRVELQAVLSRYPENDDFTKDDNLDWIPRQNPAATPAAGPPEKPLPAAPAEKK